MADKHFTVHVTVTETVPERTVRSQNNYNKDVVLPREVIEHAKLTVRAESLVDALKQAKLHLTILAPVTHDELTD